MSELLTEARCLRSNPLSLDHKNPAPAGCLELGQAYLQAPDESGTARPKRLYGLYSRWTGRLFSLIRLQVVFTEQDPYTTTQEMRKQVARTGVMRVFSGGNEHPLLSPKANLEGRAVHDLLAHLVCGCPFTATGEYNAFEAQAALYPVACRSLLFTEIVGQTCAYLAQGGRHAEQKVCFLGERYEEMAQPMRRQFAHGLGLAGVVERGWVDPRVFDLARETGYALRYAYAVLEEQRVSAIEAIRANPRMSSRQFGWNKTGARYVAPKWSPWLR